MGSCMAPFMKMKPNFITHLKLVGHLVLIMALIVLSIGLMQNILNLLAYVLHLLNESGGFLSFN